MIRATFYRVVGPGRGILGIWRIELTACEAVDAAPTR